MNNELITLEQLPIIKYHLEQLSVEIKDKVARATSLVVNDDTVKDVKQVRAELNKEFNELETQRKQVKSAIMSKYDEFEEIYKENVSELYKQADAELKEKIDNVENQLKQEKEDELREFANQYIETYSLGDILSFEDIPLNITLSVSMKSLKEQIKTYVEDISKDIDLINLEEYKEEILLEYKKTFDFAKSKLDVITRHKQLEELQQKQKEIISKFDEELKASKIVEEITVGEITAPKEIIEDNELLTATFTITTTKENIIKVREFLKKEGIEYD